MQEKLAVLDAFVKQETERLKIPGLVIGMRIEDIEFVKAYGVRSKSTGVPMEITTLLQQCSLTKSFCAAACGLLVHMGKLEWRKPIVSYLPDLMLKDLYITKTVTLIDLLSHRLGLAPHPHARRGTRQCLSSSYSLYENLKELDFCDQFRDSYNYSEIAYAIVGRLIERVSGQTFTAFVDEHLLKPLDIHGVWTTEAFLESDNHAMPHCWDTNVETLLEMEEPDLEYKEIAPFNDDNPFFSPCGTLHCSAQDMLKWLNCLLNDGKHGDQQIVYELDVITSVHNCSENSNSYLGYGCGWSIYKYDRHLIKAHNGSNPGFSLHMRFTDDFCMFVCSNSDKESFVMDLPRLATSLFLEAHESDLQMHREAIWSEPLGKIWDTQDSLKYCEGPEPEMHPEFDEFLGRFSHPAYGSIEITMRDHLMLQRDPEPAQKLYQARSHPNDPRTVFYTLQFEFEIHMMLEFVKRDRWTLIVRDASGSLPIEIVLNKD
ncbi:beta-lactamase/transpeptidase-like protein [Gorgonomyces haynaldii]|nr:beta-lactamase/transpeptidase-like protein [Gorgonomyces haynaldii]